MTPRQRRMWLVLLAMLGIGLAVALVLYALRQNINLYYTPAQVAGGEAPLQRVLRMGGMVKQGSVRHSKTTVAVSFTLTDGLHEVAVSYQGVLPDLFREGQGVVVQGRLVSSHALLATEVLAKHDEKYMPPVLQGSMPASTNGVK